MDRLYSYSQINSFNRCVYLHQLKYKRGINLIEDNSVPLDVGSAFHAGMEGHMRDGKPFVAVKAWAESEVPGWNTLVSQLNNHDAGGGFTSYQLALQTYQESGMDVALMTWDAEQMRSVTAMEAVNQASPMIQRTIKYMDADWEVLTLPEGNKALELNLQVQITEEIGIRGIIDAVMINKETGALWIVDYKTTGTLKGDALEDYNTQMALYQYLFFVTYGIHIEGSVLIQVLSKPMNKRPKVNKNNSIARNKYTGSWDVYMEVILENGQNPADYEDMRMHFEAIEHIRPLYEIRSHNEVALQFANFVEHINLIEETYDQILDARLELYKMPAPRSISSWNCANCTARSFCFAELRGDLLTHLITPEEKE